MEQKVQRNEIDTSGYYQDILKITEGGVYPDPEGGGYIRGLDSFDFNREMHLIDERYQAENALLHAVASGNSEAAMQALLRYGDLMRSPLQKTHPTSKDLLRDFKNSVLTMNTLFRKAIEDSQVHPIYIHDTSSRFGYRIEEAHSLEELVNLISEMTDAYCTLVRTCSLSGYSDLVREAILYIRLNLCGDLSTKDIAAHLSVTPNYLSSRFHAEAGITISDHIRTQRMEMAAGLLRTTTLSVQEIAGAVGIDDAGYFSRQFRRSYGVAPVQYRAEKRGGA